MPSNQRARFYVTRLSILFIGIAAVPTLILGLAAGEQSAAELEQQSLLLQQELARRVEQEIESFMEARLNELRILERTNLLATMDVPDLTVAAARLLAHDRAYQEITVLGPDDGMLMFASRTTVGPAEYRAERAVPPAASEFWRSERQFLGAVRFDSVLREPLLSIAIPILERRTGEVARVLSARIRFKQIWDLLAGLDLPADTLAMVVNGEGRVLAHPSAAVVLAQSRFDLPAQNGRGPIDGGDAGLIVKLPLPLIAERPYVVVTRPLASALEIASTNRIVTLTTAVGLILLAALLVILLSRRIVTPIEALAAAARRISSGQLDTTIEVSGPAEVSALGQALQQMTERLKTTIAELEHSEFLERQRALVTLESIADAVITTDSSGKVTYLNPVAERMSGWRAEEANGRRIDSVLNIIDEQTRKPAADPVARCLADGRIVALATHIVLLSRDGREYAIQDSAAPIRERDGAVVGVVMVFRDVTVARKRQREIAHQATHDSLTNLVNRREFEERLARVLETSRKDSSEHALCYLDLDKFKLVNDTVGHAAGDELLREIARRFQSIIRQRDTLARLGGDEFAVLMEHCSIARAESAAEALRNAAEELRFSWEGQSFRIGVSIGIAPINRFSGDSSAVQESADTACYMAKRLGRNRVHVRG